MARAIAFRSVFQNSFAVDQIDWAAEARLGFCLMFSDIFWLLVMYKISYPVRAGMRSSFYCLVDI